MTAAGTLLDLANAGITLGATGNRVTYRAPAGTMTPERLTELREHKAELLAALRDPHRTADAALGLVLEEVRDLWYARRGRAGLGRFPALAEAEDTQFDDAARAAKDGDLVRCLRLLVAWRGAWFEALEPTTPPTAPAATCAGGAAP